MISELKTELCSRCVNWLELKEGIIDCDFEHFVDIPVEKAELFISQLFDCEDFEDINKIKG